MRDAIRSTTLASALLLALGTAFTAQAAPFTYHGNLTDGGQPANGRYDLQVALYGSEQGATPLMPAATLFGVEVRDGSFSTELDLGDAAQNGGWIGVAVRPAGTDEFAALSGRESSNRKALARRPGCSTAMPEPQRRRVFSALRTRRTSFSGPAIATRAVSVRMHWARRSRQVPVTQPRRAPCR